MKGPTESDARTIPLGLARRIDEVSDRFESAWRQGEPPLIEDYLGDWSGFDRTALLKELLAVDLDFRRIGGDQPIAPEYEARFPEDASTVADALVQTGSDSNEERIESTYVEPGRGAQTGSRASFGHSLGVGGLFGDYEILEELQQGGMGIVYRARQLSTNRTVALKIIRPDRLSSLPASERDRVIRRFQREARATAQIDHPNLVSVYEVGEIDGRHYYSMQFVDGPSLDGLLKDGPVDNREAASYLEPVARAVQEAHAREILHRDLKPHNILRDRRTGRTLVADFGLAKLREGGVAGLSMSQTGEVFGAPPYMAPEQTIDSSQVTTAVDVYGLGATLYHLLTGRPPFQAASVAEVLQQVLRDEPVAPHLLNPAVDSDIETICLKCLEKEPHRRYDSAADFADELRRYLDGKPILARPLSHLGRLWRWSKRNPAVAISLSSMILVLVSATVVSTTMYISMLRAQETTVVAEKERDDFKKDFDLLKSDDPSLSLDQLLERYRVVESKLEVEETEREVRLLAEYSILIGEKQFEKEEYDLAREYFENAKNAWTRLVPLLQKDGNCDEQIAHVQVWIVNTHVMSGDHAMVIEKTQVFIDNKYGTKETFFFAATTICSAVKTAHEDTALSSDEREAFIDHYLDQACDCLRLAHVHGFFQRARYRRNLLDDEQWEPIRIQRESEFSELCSEIEAAVESSRSRIAERSRMPNKPAGSGAMGNTWREFLLGHPGT